MKISKRDKQILLIFLGVVLIFVAYYFVFLPNQEKINAIALENQALEQKVLEMEQLDAQKEHFKSEISRMTEEMNVIYDDFQVDFRSEDAFMLGRGMEENADNTWVTAIGIENPEVIYDPMAASVEQPTGDTTSVAATGGDTATAAVGTADGDFARPVLYTKRIEISQSCTSQGLKDLITYITENTDKMSIDSLSVSYDITTGILNGTTNVSVYLLQGTEKAYTPWVIPNVSTGTSNIFGTIELPSNTSDSGASNSDDSATTEDEQTDVEDED